MADVSPLTPGVAGSADLVASHAIAPQRVVRGPGALQNALPQLRALASCPVLLGRSPSHGSPPPGAGPATPSFLITSSCCCTMIAVIATCCG